MYRFRDAADADFPLIADFPLNEEEVYYMIPSTTYPLTGEQLRLKAAERGCATVVTDGEEVVAYGNLYDIEEGEQRWIGNVIVRPSSRGTGAAAYLIQTLINRAFESHRATTIRLICHNTNTRALLFYSGLGFKPYDVQPKKRPGGSQIAAIAMSLSVEGQITL